MKLRAKGIINQISTSVVIRATRFKHKLALPNYCYIHEGEDIDWDYFDTEIVITTLKKSPNKSLSMVYGITDLSHISEGDIIFIGLDGNIRTMYRVNSNQNALFVTDRCNSNCVMCSQPPNDHDDIDFYHDINMRVVKLIPKDCYEIGITGGEPTLLGHRLFELLKLIKDELPSTEVHMLSNGRLFSVNDFALKIAEVNNPRLMIGIPLYSDYYQIHDYVVQTEDAYYQTIMGIYNLKRYKIRVEIRVVMHKVTVERLPKLAEYIYKNLSFVDHIAFMGLEIMGHTKAHLDELWIDPIEYMSKLDKAVSFLALRKMNVSIYNTPLCILPEKLWQNSRKSISDWKNVYFEECENCVLADECGGFFESSKNKFTNHLKAFNEDPRIEIEDC